MNDLTQPQQEQDPDKPTEKQLELIKEVDAGSILRAASLAARGLDDVQIAEVLILSANHIQAVRFTQEFKIKLGQETTRIIEEAFDRDDAWDALETASLTSLIETARYQRDPKFQLLAARVANAAQRRSRAKPAAPKTIDAPAGGEVTNNIVILNLNRNYIDKQQNNTIEGMQRQSAELIPLKQSDIPPPKLVDHLLATTEQKVLNEKQQMKSDLEKLFDESGVVFDEG